MIRWTAGLGVALVLAGTRSTAAQAAVSAAIDPTFPTASFAAARARPAPEPDLAALNADLRSATRSSHWLTGGLVGGALLGVGGLALAAGLCNDDSGSDNCTGPIIGSALVGGQFPRDTPAAATP